MEGEREGGKGREGCGRGRRTVPACFDAAYGRGGGVFETTEAGQTLQAGLRGFDSTSVCVASPRPR